jgi:hypothetical protein
MFCLIFSIFPVIILFAWYQSKKRGEKWKAIAEGLGLTYSPGSFFSSGEIFGQLEGHRVRVWVFTRGSGKNRTTYTGISTDLRSSLGLGLKIYREHIFSGLGKMLGFQDIQTGDAAFDDRFVVKGHDPERVLRRLNGAVRRELLRYDDLVGNGKLEDTQVAWETRGVETEKGRITQVLRAQRQVAQALAAQDH